MTNAERSTGFRARRDLLLGVGFGDVISDIAAKYPRNDVARDDILDACVCCIRSNVGALAGKVPEAQKVKPSRESEGFLVAI